jgi:hypothetical protein
MKPEKQLKACIAELLQIHSFAESWQDAKEIKAVETILAYICDPEDEGLPEGVYKKMYKRLEQAH